MNDERYMRVALTLAQKGCGYVNPNPMVGAVIVKDGRIIGQGWHEKYGQLHAERNALANCEQPPEGATMYVTLEPCCHFGKTPPCTDAILQSKIARVVIGSLDPNPLVSGKGISILQNGGVEVAAGVLEPECNKLNEIFFHFITTGKPFVLMKYAMTMDGKIATAAGKSKWITGELARNNVHKYRHRYAAIMVGVGTVLADDPMLTCRMENGKNPARIICDTNLRTPVASNVVATANLADTIIATSCTEGKKHKPYSDAGCEVLVVSRKNGQADLNHLMQALGKRNIDSVLLEGGGELNFSALRSGIVNRVHAYISPKIFGGSGAKTPVGGTGISEVSECFGLKTQRITWLDEDLLIESEVEYPCLQG